MILKHTFNHKNETLVKIQYNNKFKQFEALTAAINPKTGVKIQNFGNDWNCKGNTITEVKKKIISILD